MSAYYRLYLKLESFLGHVQTCPDESRHVCHCEYLLRMLMLLKTSILYNRNVIYKCIFVLVSVCVYISYIIALFNSVVMQIRGSTFHISTHYRLHLKLNVFSDVPRLVWTYTESVCHCEYPLRVLEKQEYSTTAQ
jgi:hypothetical protein